MTDKITYGARPPKTDEEEKDKNQLLAVRAALQASEEKYRKLLDLSPDSVVILQDGKSYLLLLRRRLLQGLIDKPRSLYGPSCLQNSYWLLLRRVLLLLKFPYGHQDMGRM